jgi:secreted trypsin-like serine protease
MMKQRLPNNNNNVDVAAAVLARPVERIVGGTPVADSTVYPFMVSLRYASTHSCGAAIITEQKAVTAAQCVGNPL